MLLGALTSGLVVGALAGVLSIVPESVRLVAGALLLVVILVAEVLGRPLRLPQNGRAVPQDIIPEARVQGALQFGFEMGTGVRTFMPTALPHALVVAVLAAGGLIPGVLAGLGFGIGRAVMTLLRSGSGAPNLWDAALRIHVRTVGRLTAVGFTVVVAALLGRLVVTMLG
ncbi:hypothetical protein ACFP2T_18705 [Plantactinospora solaniradicis]|uniref:Urease accessory protein UreH-like transmembrane domain-containing protein n=1 Tax=Plantactinospora solaniradicis TaxID=1723736 RepID=A0ABW1KAH7_9ACTN